MFGSKLKRKAQLKNNALTAVFYFYLLFFAGIGSFFITIYGLMESYEDSFFVPLNLIFIFIGLTAGFFFCLFKKNTFLKIEPFILLIASTISLLIYPLSFVNGSSLAGFLKFVECISLLIMGFTIALAINKKTYFFYQDRHSEKYLVYIGFIVGIVLSTLSILSFSIIRSAFIPVFFFFIASFFILEGFLKRYVLPFVGVLIFGIFVLFYCKKMFFLNVDDSSVKMRGSFSTQIIISKEKQGDEDLLSLSPLYKGALPHYKSIYLNGYEYGRFIETSNSASYINYTPYKVLFSLKDQPKTLILNSPGAYAVYLSHALSLSSVNAIEKNKTILELIRDTESSYVGGIYHNKDTIFYRSSIRPYVASTHKKYDLIVLPYEVYPSEQNFSKQGESVLTKEAIHHYQNILNYQGLIYFSIKTFKDSLTQNIALSLIKTIQADFKSGVSLADHLLVFKARKSINIILSKDSLSSVIRQKYEDSLKFLEFNNLLESDSKTNFLQNLQYLMSGDKNQLQRVNLPVKIIQDNKPYWLFLLELYNNHSTFADTLKWFLLIGCLTLVLGSFLFIIFQRRRFSHSIDFPNMVFFFFGNSFSLGLIFMIWFESTTFLFQHEIMSGYIVLSEFFIVASIGALLIKFSLKKRYYQIIYSLIISTVLLCLYFISNQFITDVLLPLPLLYRFLTVIFIHGLIFIPSIVPFLSGVEWFSLFDSKSFSLSYYFFFFSFLMGILFGHFISLLSLADGLVFVCIACNLISLISFLWLDKFYQEHNFLYRRSRY